MKLFRKIRQDLLNENEFKKYLIYFLDNLIGWLSLQWVYMGGGMAVSVMSGRKLMQIICRKDKKKFTSEIP